jgi:hypothetical protein
MHDNVIYFTAFLILSADEAASAPVRSWVNDSGDPRTSVDLGRLTVQAAKGDDLADVLRRLADRIDSMAAPVEAVA